jgi:hypothetical protein
MIEWIYIQIPNDGEIPMDLRLLKDKVINVTEVIGNRVFFNMNGEGMFSMWLQDYDKHFKGDS